MEEVIFTLYYLYTTTKLMQSIFQTENADKALKYRLYRHLPAYEKIIRNLVSFYTQKEAMNLLKKGCDYA